MTETTLDDVREPAFFEQTWDLSYRHALGRTVGTFFEGLRSKKLLGRSCASCERVLFPARSFCDRCHQATGDWVEVGRSGTLEMFTIVYEPFPGMLVDAPYVLAYALLEGADTAVAGYVRGLDLTDPAAAAQRLSGRPEVVVRFVDSPEGRVTDFWFELGES